MCKMAREALLDLRVTQMAYYRSNVHHIYEEDAFVNVIDCFRNSGNETKAVEFRHGANFFTRWKRGTRSSHKK